MPGARIEVVAVARTWQERSRAETVLANWARDPHPSEFDHEIGREIDRIEQAIRDKDDRVLKEYGDLQACLKRIVELKDLHRSSSAGTMIHGFNDMALETAPWRRILNADRRASVLIGECTSDNGVHVHRNAISMCAPALPYVAACLTVAARPPELRRRSGAFGRRRERPPGFDASIGIGEGWHVHAHATLRRGSLPSSNP